MRRFIPFCRPLLGKPEERKVLGVLRSDWITTGPRVREFENKFARRVGAEHALAVSSCTAALHISLAALDVGPGDEVITSPLTFAATANVAVHLGARPVFSDVDSHTLCLDPRQVEKKITRRTSVVIPVHYAGHPCDMDRMIKIARSKRLHVVEDAAHALGAAYNGRPIGSISESACFSFYPIKNITTGEGGMITSPSRRFLERCRLLSLHGLSRDAWGRYGKSGSWAYSVVESGYKCNMTDIQAALGICQLRRLEWFLKIRRRYAGMYSDAFADRAELILPVEMPWATHAWHLYAVRLRLEMLRIGRAAFIEELRREGIGASVHFIPLHLQPFYRKRFGYRRGMFPVAETAGASLVSLPLYPRMRPTDVGRVADTVLKLLKRFKR